MDQDNAKVSVIVPVYNAERYLDICVKSIVEQTYKNLEILLVDDGSKDQSRFKCDQWEKNDSRIKAFHKENEGVSSARNYGMEFATGKYLTFVDSDDWIEPNTIEHAIEIAADDGSDIVFWPYIRETVLSSIPVHFFTDSFKIEGQEVKGVMVRKLFGPYGKEVNKPEQMDWCSTVWGKLYRSSLIEENGYSFVDLKTIGSFEDGLFNISAFSKACAVSYLDRCFYHYRRLSSGQLTSTYDPAFFARTQNLYSILRRLCNELGDEKNVIAFRNRMALGMNSIALNITRDKKCAIAKIRKINEILNNQEYKEAFGSLDIRGMPFYWKAFYFCCRKRFGISVYLMACIMRIIKAMKNG